MGLCDSHSFSGIRGSTTLFGPSEAGGFPADPKGDSHVLVQSKMLLCLWVLKGTLVSVTAPSVSRWGKRVLLGNSVVVACSCWYGPVSSRWRMESAP